MMVRTPDSSEDLFAEAATNWDLQKLYKDLAVAKREFAPHKKREGLTPTEKKHLRGLLCRYSPAEMAKKLYKNSRGVEADLCKTIYRYVEQLTKKPLNTLKNWRDIPEWLEQNGYKIQVFDAVDGKKAIASSASDALADIELVSELIELVFDLLFKKNRKKSSFFHQFFQEYLSAEELAISQQGCQQLVLHITEPRWRQVFLQASKKLPAADSLFQLMNQQVDMLMITDKKLQEFLRWVSKKSNSVNVSYKPAAVRLFYLTRARAIAIASDPDCAGSAIGSLIEVTTTNTIATGLDIDINTTTDIDLAIDYISALAISRTIATSTAINIYIPDVIFNAITITLDDILKENTNSEFKEKIEKLKNNLPISKRDTFKQWWLNNGLEWTKKLRNVIINYRDIGQDWQFTEAQKKLLVQYYQANKFLMECLNSGCNVSPEVRSHIEDNLFLPLDSSLS
ncbi:NACHT C-terminal helical domain 2-containing protein [Microcoleus sp. OTE_8_concoct_300]|uniref:NACHT C-terminal helical domain 2-containing protein n=1 Tax=Microcoleus sp. OTE_8_concoct_300 TaxID=2964710 RepID=UPI00403F8563